jgi:hypothetical protein
MIRVAAASVVSGAPAGPLVALLLLAGSRDTLWPTPHVHVRVAVDARDDCRIEVGDYRSASPLRRPEVRARLQAAAAAGLGGRLDPAPPGPVFHDSFGWGLVFAGVSPGRLARVGGTAVGDIDLGPLFAELRRSGVDRLVNLTLTHPAEEFSRCEPGLFGRSRQTLLDLYYSRNDVPTLGPARAHVEFGHAPWWPLGLLLPVALTAAGGRGRRGRSRRWRGSCWARWRCW